MVLAKQKVKPGGRIGFVLPRTAALAESWSATREMLLQDFTDIVIVAVEAGMALGADALSKDTHMEEMLLVATKRIGHASSESANRESIYSVTLKQSPVRSGEAGEIGRVINELLTEDLDIQKVTQVVLGEDEVGSICTFEPPKGGKPWYPVGVAQPELVYSSQALKAGSLKVRDSTINLEVEFSTIGDVFDVGPTHHLIGHLHDKAEIGAFKFFELTSVVDEIGPDRSVWTANSISQISLQVRPTHKGYPNAMESEEARDRIRNAKSTLHYARNMRWTSQKILAATTEHDVLGGRSWLTLMHPDRRVLRAYSLWFNSTFGILLHWTQGQRTHAGRSTTQVEAVKKVPCPRLDSLSDIKLDLVEDIFKRLHLKTLLPACQAHCDSVRIEIDEAVTQILDLPDETALAISGLRELWCAEPSVHGRNKLAIRLLHENGLVEH